MEELRAKINTTINTIKKIWNKLTEGTFGYVVYAILGVIAGYLFLFTLSTILQTDMPAVGVLSNSMDHGVNEWGAPCKTNAKNYEESFDNWWNVCRGFYENIGLNKEQFLSFSFRDGFKKGDLPVAQGSDSYKIGDIIIFSITSEHIPIIHRIVKINPDGTYQTKGDFNHGQNTYEYSVAKKQIHGRVIFIIPKLGYYKVITNYLFGV